MPLQLCSPLAAPLPEQGPPLTLTAIVSNPHSYSGWRGSAVEVARQVIWSLLGRAMDILHPMALTRDVSVLKSQRPAEQRGKRVRTGPWRPSETGELKSLPWVLTLGSGAWWSQITGLHQASVLLLQTRLQCLWGSPLPLLAARRDCHRAVPCHALRLATQLPLETASSHQPQSSAGSGSAPTPCSSFLPKQS